MPKIDINGIGIAYDIIGEGDKTIAITAGGRFSKDTPGLRELAQHCADAGFKALIWDRVNCGESDVNFNGETESLMNADTLAGLLRALDFGPTLLVGGSAGSRVSLMTAIRNPDLVSGMLLLWISGGTLGLATLAMFYHHESALAAKMDGMAAVADLPEWKEQVTRNPGNRDRFLAWDPDEFVDVMQRWADSFIPKSAAPVPGLNPEELAAIKCPVVVLRSGKSDIHHTRETSEALASMIPSARITDPPWGDQEWNDGFREPDNSRRFASFEKLAPMVIEFAKSL